MRFEECDVEIRDPKVGDVRRLFPLSHAIAVLEIEGQYRAFLVEGSGIINRYDFRWGGVFEGEAYQSLQRRSSDGITINYPDVTLKDYVQSVQKATQNGGLPLGDEPREIGNRVSLSRRDSLLISRGEPVFFAQFNGFGTPFLQRTPDCLEGVIEEVWEVGGNGFPNVLISAYHSDESISSRENAKLKLVWDMYGSLDKEKLTRIENPLGFEERMNPEWVSDGIKIPYKIIGIPTGPETPAQWPANADPTMVIVTVYDRKHKESNIIPCMGIAYMGDSEQGGFIGISFGKNSPSQKEYNDRYWERYSTHLVLEEKEMDVSIPCIGMESAVMATGRNSFRKVGSKWKMLNGYWTPRPSKKIRADLIAQCYAGFECTVERVEDLGSHYWVIGRVVQVHVDKRIESGQCSIHWNPLTQVAIRG
jgi:flavin reductase (DIM6/NTAB) family NADH-FMN oxidoreductase RutF